MVSLIEQINSQRRAPVTYYAARPPSRPYVQPSSRYTPPAPSPPSGAVDWNAFSAAAAAYRQQNPLPQQTQEPSGFGGTPFGKGLGFLINNPVTRAITAPINYIQTGGRLATLGIEELGGAVAGHPAIQNTLGMVPGLGELVSNVDTERTAADPRSNWAKVLEPNSTYGYGELLNPDNPPWVNRIMGLGGDIALDPLTYVGGGATRTVAGASHIDEALEAVQRATRMLEAAEEAGDAKQAARAVEQLARAEDYAARAPALGRKTWELPTPRNRAERANLFGELADTAEGRRLIEEMPDELLRGGTRGFQTMAPEAKAALGISEPGLRLRGFNTKVPLTGPVAELLNWGGGGIRQGLANLPGGGSKIRNIRTPKGMNEVYETLTRGGEGDLLRAATKVSGRNKIRVGAGEYLARGNRELVRGVRENVRGKSDEVVRAAVTEAELSPKPNWINNVARKMLEQYQSVTGRVIDPQYLRNPDTYFPHLLDPKWRRYLARLSKGGSKAAQDFMNAAGLRQDELLEDPAFYADNLLEGSGFLEKSRKLGTKDGEPQTVTIGGKEITFTADDAGHINEKLAEAFPQFKGDFYDMDPVRVLEAYNKSLSRQAGRDVAKAKLNAAGNPLVPALTGDLDATRLAMDEALAQQNAAPLLSTAQGKYDPTQPLPAIPPTPVVPGASMRPQIEAMETAARGAASPEEAAALTAEAAAIPARAPGVGGIDPAEYFVTTEGELATKARKGEVKRAGTYATAAAAEVRSATEKLRQGLYDLKEMVVSPLKTAIGVMDGEIRAINTKIKQWGKTITDMGDLKPENVDEMSDLVTKVEAEILNTETKLKRTAASWKGRATRKQRAAEARLRTELEKLKRLRVDAWEKARSAPREIREEIELRERTLNQPVRDAHETLLRAEIMYAIDNPVPHNQAAVDGALGVLMGEAEEGVDPMELRNRLRSILGGARETAEEALRETGPDRPEVAAKRAEWHGLVQTIRDIADRPKWRGRLRKADLKELNEAIARRQQLAVELGEADRLSSFDQAVLDLAAVEKRIDVATGVTRTARRPPTPAAAAPRAARPAGAAPLRIEDLHPAMKVVVPDGRVGRVLPVRGGDSVVVELDDGTRLTFRRSEVAESLTTPERAAAAEVPITPSTAPPAAPVDLSRLRAERNRLRRLFRPGGKFYEHQQAQGVINEMAAWEKKLAAATTREQEVLRQAEIARINRQEAIIWKNQDRTSRYTTRFGERPSRLEEMGRGTYQQRVPEPITTPPQDAAYPNPPYQEQLVAGPRGPEVERQAFPPPRTEAEAIQSLRSLEETGGPAAMGAEAEYRNLSRQLAEGEAIFPERLAQEQADIAEVNTMDMERELGPLAERAKTYTNLKDDLSDRRNLVVKRQEARDLRDRLKANPKAKYSDLGRILDELDAVAKANPYLDDPKLNQVESILQTHRVELERINETKMRVRDLDRVVEDAKDGKLAKVMIATLNSNWKALHTGPLNTGDIIMDADLHKHFTNLFELDRQPRLLGRLFNGFTNLFKTYATLTPGFFVRNAIGGVFMNTADGVSLRAQVEGVELWNKWMKGGNEWLADQPRRVQEAFTAATSSGAGGRFEESGVAAKDAERVVQPDLIEPRYSPGSAVGDQGRRFDADGHGARLDRQWDGRGGCAATDHPCPLRLHPGLRDRRDDEADHPVLDVHVEEPAVADPGTVDEPAGVQLLRPSDLQLLLARRRVHPRLLVTSGRMADPGVDRWEPVVSATGSRIHQGPG